MIIRRSKMEAVNCSRLHAQSLGIIGLTHGCFLPITQEAP